MNSSIQGLRVLDFNCMLGPTNTNSEPSFRDCGELLREMDRLGIEDALVYSSLARLAHPVDGNQWLISALQGQARLHACWVGLPPGNGELPEPVALVEQMQAQKVRALRLLPVAHRYPVFEQTLRPLLKALSAAKIPLILDMDRAGWSEINPVWREIFEIAERHPDLSLILVREGGATARVLFPVWDQYPNIRLETSYLQEASVAEEIVSRFGAEKLIFGGGMPKFDAGGPLAALAGANYTAAHRSAIAGNTARNLLGLPEKQGSVEVTWPGEKAFRIFDTHGHIGRWDLKYYPDWSPRHMVERMDRLGIERFAVSDTMAIGPDYKSGNTRIGKAVAEFPDRLVGYAVYNPHYEAEMKDEMSRCFDELGCKGIKLHCALHETLTADRKYRLAFETAHERHCPVLCHTGGGPTVEFFRELLTELPGCQFIYAHVGGATKTALEPLLEAAQACPNFFFELSLSNMPRAALAWLVQNAPVDQILFGSDHPLNDFAFQLGRVLFAEIDDAAKQKILWDNAARIFNV